MDYEHLTNLKMTLKTATQFLENDLRIFLDLLKVLDTSLQESIRVDWNNRRFPDKVVKRKVNEFACHTADLRRLYDFAAQSASNPSSIVAGVR